MMWPFKRKTNSQPTEKKSFRTYEVMPRQMTWTPNWREFTDHQAIEHGLNRSTWLYAAARLRAVNVASVPFIAERMRAGEWEELPDSPLQRLLRQPNEAFDWSMLIRRAMYWLDLTGNAWLTIVRNGAGEPRELWPLIPDSMTVLTGTDSMVAGYKYRKGQTTKILPAEDVLHLRFANPNDLYYGLPPLQAAARAVDIDEEAESWQKTSLQNMGVPPGVVTINDEAITQEKYEQYKKWVKDQSGPENAGKTWTLANAEFAKIAQNALELDFVQGRKMTREEILSAYSVPPPLVGIYENATLANIETARQILWREGLIPVLEEITQQINLQLAREFGDDIRIRYDLSNVEALRENLTEKLNDAKTLWSLGVPLDQINQRLELGLNTDEIEGSDIGYIPSGVFPAGEETAVDDSPGGNAEAEVAFGEGDEPAEKPQETALNGAQIQALQSIAQSVADGLLPAEAAIQIIRVGFPTIDEEQAGRIIDPMDSFEPESVNGEP